MKLPIRLRMTVWYVALLTAIVAAVGAFLIVRLRADLTGAIDSSLRPATGQIALGYHTEGVAEVPDISGTVLSGDRAASQVLDASGRVLAVYGDPISATSMLTSGQLRAVIDGRRLTRTAELGRDGRRFRVAAQATTRAGRPVAVVAAQSLAPVDRSVHRVLILLLIAGPAALLATAAGGWWLARRALRPMELLRAEAQAIGGGRVDGRLAVPPTQDEVARLAATLNTMLARIARGVEQQHRLVADASHELRTPLTAMRAELDVSLRADDLPPAAREVLGSTREEVDRLSRTVDDLLALAALDEGPAPIPADEVDLGDVAAEAVDALRPFAEQRGVTVRCETAPAPARGDELGLRHAVRNLVDNATRYSPSGSTVVVRSWTAGGETGVTVLDDGPGIPPDLRPRIFDRFVRGDSARTRHVGGSGLGLAIVHEVARSHGGRAWLEPQDPTGSAFSLAIPAGGASEPGPPAFAARSPGVAR